MDDLGVPPFQETSIWSSISLNIIALGADAGQNAGLKKEVHTHLLAHRLIDRDYLDICSLCVFEACLLDLFGLVLYLASCGLDSSLDAIELCLAEK